jgi:hypothetical protein
MILRSGKSLPAGSYRVVVPENSKNPLVTFKMDGKVIAAAKARVISEARKNTETSVEGIPRGKTELLTKINPGGWYESLAFRSNKS